jgi:uncharacterized membrane protein
MKIEKKDIFDGLLYGLFINFVPLTFFLTSSLAEGDNRFSIDIVITFCVTFILAFALYMLMGNFRHEIFNIDKLKANLKEKNALLKLILFYIILTLSFFLYKKHIIADYIFALILTVSVIVIFYMAMQSKKKFG